jgi:protein-S-isoprenylcysteine O-methyltransferase Ste14
MLTPSGWVPERLPLWGTVLGVVAGLLAAFVLDLPSRIVGSAVPTTIRVVGVLVLMFFYYILWTFVRTALKRLSGSSAELSGGHVAKHLP